MEQNLPTGSQKPQQTAHTVEIFSEVAPKYEFLNAVMTAGMDKRWRNSMLEVCESAIGKKPDAALDLATGTGDVARMMADRWPGSKVIGTDPTPAMLEVAKAKALGEKVPRAHRRIDWKEGVAEAITAEDGTLDVVTIAFGFRNVAEDLRQKAAEEAFRVLKPGGVFAILELGLPRGKLSRVIYSFLLKKGMPKFASFFAPRAPYDYLAQSVIDFPAPDQVKKMLSKSGFLAFAPRPLSGGMTWLYVGKRPVIEN
ncbi:MAG TPA: ubiquinone/menaquinone biosynthesis methyltransferase [Bdellovibrionota bacterium]|jgi:demethylmenaquinone methyltransferase/2-methoxy-6-polyprenyl-1,4-benzoquinol methylase